MSAGYANPPVMTARSSSSDEEETPGPGGGGAPAGWSVSPAVNSADFTTFFNTCCGAVFVCFGECVAVFSGCAECCGECCAECLRCG